MGVVLFGLSEKAVEWNRHPQQLHAAAAAATLQVVPIWAKESNRWPLSLLFKKRNWSKKLARIHKERKKGGQRMESMTNAIVFGRFMICSCIYLLPPSPSVLSLVAWTCRSYMSSCHYAEIMHVLFGQKTIPSH